MKLIAVRKNDQGEITHFLTDHHRVISFAEAKRMVEEGKIDSLTDIRADGTWMIDDRGQHLSGTNLDDLPEF
ncbi:MAG: hypothetical protein H0Z33_15705 [Bacillaceae bacterium]|nr:hypothetical protein [Bacillaceae bacterium]